MKKVVFIVNVYQHSERPLVRLFSPNQMWNYYNLFV